MESNRYTKEVPSEVAQVAATARASAKRGLAPILASRAVYLQEGHTSEGEDEWSICDNFERFCDLILCYNSGVWSTRTMHGDTPRKEISFSEALANAELMFSDGLWW